MENWSSGIDTDRTNNSELSFLRLICEYIDLFLFAFKAPQHNVFTKVWVQAKNAETKPSAQRKNVDKTKKEKYLMTIYRSTTGFYLILERLQLLFFLLRRFNAEEMSKNVCI